MKKKILSIFVAAAVAVSMPVNLLAVSAADAAGNTAYTSMNENEKQAFIHENLDVRLQNLSTLVTLTANRAYAEIADAVEAARLKAMLRIG